MLLSLIQVLNRRRSSLHKIRVSEFVSPFLRSAVTVSFSFFLCPFVTEPGIYGGHFKKALSLLLLFFGIILHIITVVQLCSISVKPSISYNVRHIFGISPHMCILLICNLACTSVYLCACILRTDLGAQLSKKALWGSTRRE